MSMKTTVIQYPTNEWIENWIDDWMENNPNEKVSDFDELRKDAEQAWWYIQVDKGNPTPFDLTAEQEKVSKEARNGMAKSAHQFDKNKPKQKRERKPDEVKRDLISKLAVFLAENGMEKVAVTNPEKTIDFLVGDQTFSLSLVKHRAPKADK